MALPLQAFAPASMLGCTLSHLAPEPEVTAAGMMAGCHETEPLMRQIGFVADEEGD